ncbi:hypothetical protein [Sphingomonas parapaucimobilis]|uniref:Uncharacterized protein n=1 Tax=Sphingomonas parapaucimobilis NBRC 15100 TaxID=1219049 RepID=A0A0A1W732_9SPHN|nr:hypothetical protein [Sphingomonas parapaucimobilis]GAM00714.1 hypothetical protein SP5_035_01140 [Sphingomonas parapaucimobilis NBRC 15100]
MAKIFASPVEPMAAGIAGPLALGDASLRGGKIHSVVKMLDLAAQPVIAVGDTIDWGGLPKGAVPLASAFNPSVTMGAATLDLGRLIGATLSPAVYRSPSTYQTPDVPAWGMKATAFGQFQPASCRLVSTVAAAALPATGILTHVIFYTLPHGG